MPRPTRRTQPYRGGGQRGPARAAMKRGRPLFGPNPMDKKRAVMKKRRSPRRRPRRRTY